MHRSLVRTKVLTFLIQEKKMPMRFEDIRKVHLYNPGHLDSRFYI